MVVWLSSWPRSGNTLCRILLKHYCGVNSYSYADDPLFKGDVRSVIGHTPMPASLSQLCDEHRHSDSHIFVKIHHRLDRSPYVDGDKVIYIVRDCRDAIVSLSYYASWRKHEDFNQSLRRRIRQNNWAKHVQSWTELDIPIIKYEDMVHAPYHAIKVVVNSLDLGIQVRNSQSLPSFTDLHNALPRFFREGQIGSWQRVLTPEQESIIWNRNGSTMEYLGYRR